MALLQVHGLEVRYGKIRAVAGLDLEVDEGEVVAMVGVNGAGKTSTICAICGVVPSAGGRIVFGGKNIGRLSAHRRMALGIAHVPEGRQIFTNMTVRENLLLGGYHRSDQRHLEREIEYALDPFPTLQSRLHEQAFNLSGGELQMLALARGLMAKPRLLLLDEPSLGLAPKIVNEVFRLVGALQRKGMTILLVEQNVRQALTVANRGYVLESGRIVLTGRAKDLLEDESVARHYLGFKRVAPENIGEE